MHATTATRPRMLALAPLICKTYVPALIIFRHTVGRQIWFGSFAASLSFALVALAFGPSRATGSIRLGLVGRSGLAALG